MCGQEEPEQGIRGKPPDRDRNPQGHSAPPHRPAERLPGCLFASNHSGTVTTSTSSWSSVQEVTCLASSIPAGFCLRRWLVSSCSRWLPLRPQLSPDCQDLLRRLLERDPGRRISFQDFFAHPWVDLDHMPSEESLARATILVVQAVKKDQEGDAAAALSLYCKALDFFVPALHYEVDAQRKEAIKAKVRQYVSRAEELKAIVSSSNQALLRQGASAQDLLREMARDKPRLLAALEVASAAVAKEEEAGGEQDALDLYQHSLGELLLLLAGEPPGRRRELLHTEVQNLMARAEYLKEQVKLAPCSDHRKMTAQTMGHLKLGDTPRLLPGILWPLQPGGVAFLDGQPCEHRVPGSLTASGCPPPHKGSDGPALHGLGALGLAPGEGAGLWEKCLM
ncbi:serine/threonine-protein kinase ULK3 isoform X8 [Myotis myotis]|uniref:serine/threonine-protein kinase ULK3 isoform X8 n=1 Tax=Myotis myotis TaxID=51298 RepID=UPI001748737F|nr:serine/threonine-protein kinase ULK3 isoform X8 [Myotis myotis]